MSSSWWSWLFDTEHHHEHGHRSFGDRFPALRLVPNARVEKYIAHKRRENSQLSTRDRIFLFLASPASSRGATIFASMSFILSVFAVGVQAAENFYDTDRVYFNATRDDIKEDQFFVIDMTLLCLFGLEYAFRIVTYHRPWEFWMIWVEAVTLVQLVLRVSIDDPQVSMGNPQRPIMMLLDACAPLRLLKITRYFHGSVLMMRAFMNSVTALTIPFYSLLTIVVVGGSLLYAVEFNANAQEENARPMTLVDAWYMTLVTMTTVGYGDFTPQTELGKAIVSVYTFIGLSFVAMPLAIVGNNFSEVWNSRLGLFVADKIRGELLAKNVTKEFVKNTFASFDVSGDGRISFRDMKKVCTEDLRVTIDTMSLRKLWTYIAHDHSGTVDFLDFVEAIFPQLYDTMADAFEREAELELRESAHARAIAAGGSPNGIRGGVAGGGVQGELGDAGDNMKRAQTSTKIRRSESKTELFSRSPAQLAEENVRLKAEVDTLKQQMSELVGGIGRMSVISNGGSAGGGRGDGGGPMMTDLDDDGLGPPNTQGLLTA